MQEGGSPLSDGQALAERIGKARRIVAFTGAGMSTESGLADFRSSRGHWKRYDPLAMASVEALQSRSPAFYDFYRMRIAALVGVEPHQGHRILARWEDEGRLQAVITQNVDRLHQAAGSRRVVELHGNLREVSCTQCRQRFPSTVLLEGVDCALCGGALRPAVVLFGEYLPGGPFAEAEKLAESCDLLLVLGSSLTVSPANVFPGVAQSGGADLVIVNRGATPYDGRADLVIDGAIGEVLAAADACLGEAGDAGGQEG
jgi:NAD-dependent deacetylase